MSEVRDNAEQSRYEVLDDGTVAGIAHYVTVEGGRIFDHTKIEPAFEGKGLGSLLARGALDDVRARGIRIGVTCPFIASFLERHPEYTDLVDPALTA